MALSKENINYFFNKASFAGLCTIYGITISKEKSIAINLTDFITNSLGPNNVQYCHGFLVACASFELVTFNNHHDILTVQAVDTITSEEVKNQLSSRFNHLTDDYKNNILNKIESYFK